MEEGKLSAADLVLRNSSHQRPTCYRNHCIGVELYRLLHNKYHPYYRGIQEFIFRNHDAYKREDYLEELDEVGKSYRGNFLLIIVPVPIYPVAQGNRGENRKRGHGKRHLRSIPIRLQHQRRKQDVKGRPPNPHGHKKKRKIPENGI